MEAKLYRVERISHPREGGPDLDSAEDIVDLLMQYALRVTSEEKEVYPLLLLVYKDRVDFLDVHHLFDTSESKDMLRSFVVDLCANDADIEGVGLLTEIWFVMRSVNCDAIDDIDATRPRHDPERQEGLMVYGEWKDCSSRDLLIPYDRDADGKPVLRDALDIPAGAEGRLRGFFLEASSRHATLH